MAVTTFFLGTHMPHWLGLLDVPLFVSHRRLGRMKTLPRARGTWALDSGGFSELALFGEWRTTARQYVAAGRRYRDEIGGLAWMAPRDMMCEPFMVKKTGLSVAEHQSRTVADFLNLREIAPDLPIVPVLQGWDLVDYLRCADMYERAGVNLAGEETVGIGSVCRRQATGEIGLITSTLAARGIRLHGFGVKTEGLEEYGQHLATADSMAWSFGGRKVRPCAHGRAQSEANCIHFALAWRDRLLARLSSGLSRPQQLALNLFDLPAVVA